MEIRQFVDEGLGNSAHLVISERASVAALIDPLRDVDQYLEAARAAGVMITHVFETHVHNDFLTGSRELAARTGARICASARAGLQFEHQSLRDGDEVIVGDVSISVLATPGHTPDHVSYLASDLAQPQRPSVLFSGGSLLVGSVSRTDLLGHEHAAGLARELYRSLHEKVLPLPDDVAVYPTHGAGSFCTATPGAARIRLGLRDNWQQFALLVVVNAFVGGMVGLERVVVPLLAEQEFGLASRTAILSFIVSFGVVKALANLFAGRMSDRIGRKRILVAGWLVGLPVPFLVMLAPSWEWVVFANVLLGINQGLCWSTTVIMKIDLVGPARRGLAMGLNEAAGYVAVSLAALASGYLAATYALRPQPFYLGVAFALAGLLLSVFLVRDTHGHARHESALPTEAGAPTEAGPRAVQPSFAQILLLTSWKDRALFSASQAGLVNNLNDGMAWGLFPLFFAAAGLDIEQIGVLAAIYPGVWGLSQLGTGALSDRLGRKGLIVAGMWVQAGGLFLLLLTRGFLPWAAGMVLLGLGTALVYPTLLAAVSDVAHPDWRASAVGVYRLWRDGGYALGALLAGVLADALGVSWAIAGIGALTFASGVVVLGRMYETLPGKQAPAAGASLQGIP